MVNKMNETTETTEKIKWVTFIPLIGGMPLGAEIATGNPPEAVYSYDGFQANDSQYLNYQNNTLNRNIDYITINDSNKKDIKKTFEQKPIDLVVLTCPCAGLSSLNTSTDKNVRDSQNVHMFNSAIDAIELMNPTVIIGENAPRLATPAGNDVREKLNEIAKEHGYSFGTYKTSTHFHGIPQKRDRTFYMFYKSDRCPIINFEKKQHKNLSEYLEMCKYDTLQADLVINTKLTDEPYYSFVKHKYGNPKNARDTIISSNKTSVLNFIKYNNLINEALEYFEKTNNEPGIKHCTRLIEKTKINKGVWDSSANIPNTVCNAIISRNMYDMLHPTEERSLNIRECFHLMGFPNNFELVGARKNFQMISQNVPVCTSSFIIGEMTKFINNKLPLAQSRYIMQDNWNEKTILKEPVYLNDLNDNF